MHTVAALLGIEDVSLDAQKRITSINAANGRVSLHLLLLDPAGRVPGVSFDLRLESAAALRSDTAPDEGLFVCSALGEIDGDGSQAIVCAVTRKSGAYLLSYKQSAGGEWSKTVISPNVTGLNFIRSVSIGDVDQDGKQEIVLASRPNGRVAYFRNDGGTYSEHLLEENTYGAGTTNAREVLVTDSDGDGRNEVLVATARTDAEKWAFTPGALLQFKHQDGAFVRTVISDFDGQTHSRMIRFGRVGRTAQPALVVNEVGVFHSDTKVIDPPTRMVLLRNAAGSWHKEHVADIEGAVKSRGFALGDVDHDGENELVAGTRAVEMSDPSHLYVFKQSADGTWSSNIIESSGAMGYHLVETADIDGDGADEILASDDSKGLLKTYKRTAGGWEIKPFLSWDHALFCVSMYCVAGLSLAHGADRHA
jgi:hypothetical protein